MTASANPSGRFSKYSIDNNGGANGETSFKGAVPEDAVAILHPNFGTSLDWSPNEQSILEDLLSKSAQPHFFVLVTVLCALFAAFFCVKKDNQTWILFFYIDCICFWKYVEFLSTLL